MHYANLPAAGAVHHPRAGHGLLTPGALPTCAAHGPITSQCLNCDTPLCRGCKHYEINGRPWCASCSAPYRESLLAGMLKDAGKLALIIVAFVTVTTGALIFSHGQLLWSLFWGGIAVAGVGLKVFWPSERVEVLERGGR